MTAPAIPGPIVKVDRDGPKGPARSLAARPQVSALDRRKANWFTAFFFAICFEGLGRKYLTFIPGEAFYFLKDAVLLYGFFFFKMDPRIGKVLKVMYRPFGVFLTLAAVVSAVQVFNTGFRVSFLLGIIGLRAYWLWWLAVPVVGNILLAPWVRRRAIFVLSFVAGVVAILAIVQFNSPATSAVNYYAMQVGGEEYTAYEVGSTGRARVSSTFSFITGFTDFVVLIPALLLSVGLGEPDKRTRFIVTATALLCASSLPMSGSRAPFVVGLLLLAVIARETGSLLTRVGRRVMLVGVLATLAVSYVFPDSLKGIMDRFDSEDTDSRFTSVYTLLPPVALATLDYPPLGIGTGMQQNFRGLFGVGEGEYESEGEVGRHLIELGVPGYLFFWFARIGLMVAFFRAVKLFRLANRRASAGAATAYAAVTLYGNLTFDHIWQALFFTGMGFVLQELVTVWPLLYPNRPLVIPPPPPTGRAT